MNNIKFFLLFIIVAIVGCNRPKDNVKEDKSNKNVYENELFSVTLPEGWKCDSSGWNGLEAMNNEVVLYSESEPILLRFVKVFMPEEESLENATKFVRDIRLSNPDVYFADRKDSLEIGGYPTTLLCYLDCTDNDTLAHKQYVTYLEDSHIVVYFNELFKPSNADIVEKLGDQIIYSVQLKKVDNPLLDSLEFRRAIDEAKKKQDKTSTK